jgi:malate synthase
MQFDQSPVTVERPMSREEASAAIMNRLPITPSFVDIYADDKALILRVSRPLYNLVANELAPKTGVFPLHFWMCMAHIVKELGPHNKRLLEQRDELQQQIDQFFKQQQQQQQQPLHANDAVQQQYVQLLRDIGYIEAPIELAPDATSFAPICTQDIDAEIGQIAAAQLVVPLDNARFVVNAANARWYSLYDALYASDMVGAGRPQQGAEPYNIERGLQVIAWTDQWLDSVLPLANGASHSQVRAYRLASSATGLSLVLDLADGAQTHLMHSELWVGYTLFGDGAANTTRPKSLVFRHNDLHIELQFYDSFDTSGGNGRAPNGSACGIRDVIVEAAASAIADMEDSVAAVDSADKTNVYRNWLGLMKGSLTATFTAANGKQLTRTMADDRLYRTPSDPNNTEALRLHGRSLLLVRNVGMHMYTDAVRVLRLHPESGASLNIWDPIPEAFVDAMICAFAALHDIRPKGKRSARCNSRTGSVYIVKPKMHGSREVAFTCELFSRVEDVLELPRNTLKVCNMMDETLIAGD